MSSLASFAKTSLPEKAMIDECARAVSKLLRYCRSESWAGYDPYDGLNSPLSHSFLFRNAFARTFLTQLVKRSPINLRPLLGIKKDFNPKGVALAARALMLLDAGVRNTGFSAPSQSAENEASGFEADLSFLLSKLSSLRSNQYAEACWGYNFDWKSRAFFVPRGTPNVVCTVLAAHAYLDWYERTGSDSALEVARSSCGFLLDRINRSQPASGAGHCFSYTPLDHSQVHNVNLLAAELLSRTYSKTCVEQYREAAESAVSFTVSRQRSDGSWPYGEAQSQSWIDSFHTGFVLVTLKHLIEDLRRNDLKPALKAGYEFYSKRFFLADGTPGYYHDRLYPIDVHSAAQGVITFAELKDLMPNAEAMAGRIIKWALDNLQDSAGFFYFQKHRLWTNKLSYMRWAQAWMLYALSLYLSQHRMTENV
jgi:hypothetical protein